MMQRPLRKYDAPLRLKLRAAVWCSVATMAILGLVASVQYARGGLDNVDVAGAWNRRLQYWDDLIIPRECCEVPIGETVSRPTYHLAPVGKKFAIVIHIIVIGYMLLGLNTVCDVYFTGALDKMVEKWNIKPDVAGATFMAAGGSAPELFTSLIGACVTVNQVGFSTIVGSAVFNVLFVIGCCGVFAKKPIALTWWPLFRDCTFYIAGLTMLALFARSPYPAGVIVWWEALILFLFYICYCVMMYFNENIEATVKGWLQGKKTKVAPECSAPEVTEDTSGDRLRAAGGANDHADSTEVKGFSEQEEQSDPPKTQESAPEEAPEIKVEPVETPELVAADTDAMDKEDSEDGDDIENMMTKPDTAIAQFIWYLSLPIYGPLYYLTPKPENMFLGTFGISLVWIAFYSFFLVYCVEVLGEVIGIPVVVMGFTLLAAGTSIPDLVSSVAVAREGEGDMAVSSSIGSNIFDILVGLPIPWLLKTLVVDPIAGDGVTFIPVDGFIVFYVLVLLFMVFMVILSINGLGWKLNKCLGVYMGVLYILFLGTALIVEFLSVNMDLSALQF